MNLKVGDKINVVVDWFGVLGATVVIDPPEKETTNETGGGEEAEAKAGESLESLDEQLEASMGQMEGLILQNEIALFRAARG